ncbi:MAG: DUF1275 domain-containing protein [Fimbriimonadaceae bacterium]|nr:DUF1275 domain-containing protein [Fimbriimonadaceae bacterium]
MTRYDRQSITFAMALSLLAGYVDASGFLSTGGLFVSFMSGNSTRLGVKSAASQGLMVVLIFGVIALFVCGVIAGTLVSRFSGDRRKTAVLGLVVTFLLVAAVALSIGSTYVATAFMVMAMGAENSVFQRDGEVSIGVTYMTGTLVKMGQNLAAMLLGGSRTSWFPYFLLWVGLVSGATLGALTHAHLRSFNLWPACVLALVLLAYSPRVKVSAAVPNE